MEYITVFFHFAAGRWCFGLSRHCLAIAPSNNVWKSCVKRFVSVRYTVWLCCCWTAKAPLLVVCGKMMVLVDNHVCLIPIKCTAFLCRSQLATSARLWTKWKQSLRHCIRLRSQTGIAL